MTTTALEKAHADAKLRLQCATTDLLLHARVIAGDYRRGSMPSLYALRRLCALTEEMDAAQATEHRAGAAVVGALDTRGRVGRG